MKRLLFRFGLKTCTIRITMLSLAINIALSAMVFARTPEEFALGDIPLNKETYEKHIKKLPQDRLEYLDALPESYDARDEGIVTSAKSQGNCGSCWAFASMGALESHILKAGGPTYDLSEQQQVSCNLDQYGCCGGSSNALQYWQSTGPILESCGLYGESSTSCPTQRTLACSSVSGCSQLSYRVTDWHTVTTTPSGFKDSCYNEGPSYWRFTVYDDFYDFWYGGSDGEVYANKGETVYLGGHAVLIIGWDDAKGAYLCKNSWGASGGPNGDGTFWIAYSGHANDLGFGMSNFDITGGTASCPDCSGGAVNLTGISFPAGRTCPCNATSITIGTGVTIPSGATVVFNADSFISISNGSGLTIPDGATVTFSAPTITVAPGFHAESGAVVNMERP